METRTFKDQMGRAVLVPYPPQRIISLVPSQTELLFDLGLHSQIVGLTKFCIHPYEKFKATEKVGGTKKLDLQKIRNLKPDLIIGNKEENEQSAMELLMKELPVWMSDIQDVDDALEMINLTGRLTGREIEGRLLSAEADAGFQALKKQERKRLRTAYFIWKDPFMVAGSNTFINDVMRRGGYENVIIDQRYPVITPEQIRELNPEVIFLSSEPYPFKNNHVIEMEKICPDAEVVLVDGEMFSWYGSRLLKTPAYLNSLAASLKQFK